MPITMQQKKVPVKVLEVQPEGVKVELPFLEIPVTMDYRFFKKRMDAGYFQLLNTEMTQQLKQKLLD